MSVLHSKKNYKVSTKQLDCDTIDAKNIIRFETTLLCNICSSNIVRKASVPDKQRVSIAKYVIKASCENGHLNGELIVTY